MAILQSCWLIIECVLIPPGIRKWYCLSFFIHPIFLVCCEFYLFGTSIVCWSAFLLFYPYKAVWYGAVGAFRLVGRGLWELIVIAELDDESIRRLYSEARPTRWYEYLGPEEEEEEDLFQSLVRYKSPKVFPVVKITATIFEAPAEEFRTKKQIETRATEKQELQLITTKIRREAKEDHKQKEEGEEEEEEEEYWQDANATTEAEEKAETYEELASHVDENQETENFSLATNNSQLVVLEIRNQILRDHADEFYDNYKRKMQWFDRLCMEKLYTVGSIVHKNVKDRSFFENFKSHMLQIGDMYGKHFVKSIESDFELVYVAQTCLCWEALHHHYRKVEALIPSLNDHEVNFHSSVAKTLQQFHIRLDRFTEDELRKEKRFWNYIQERHRNQNFLQVPEISGYVDGADDGEYEDVVRTEEVLRNIENAIRVFKIYLEADNCETQRKLVRFMSIKSHVENPNDLILHDNLRTKVRKMEKKLKGLQSQQVKENWWQRSTAAYGDVQRKEVLFSIIDVSLVSRVLKMSSISTRQLQWCEQKFHGVQIRDERVVRTRGSSELSFPFS